PIADDTSSTAVPPAFGPWLPWRFSVHAGARDGSTYYATLGRGFVRCGRGYGAARRAGRVRTARCEHHASPRTVYTIPYIPDAGRAGTRIATVKNCLRVRRTASEKREAVSEKS